jgi:putative ABC transport system permease protein
MSIWRSLTSGLRTLFRKEKVEQEMDEELRGYLDAAAKDKVRAGMSNDQAQRAVRVEMGSIDGVKEEIRSAGWESTLETIWHDLRFGARQLKRNTSFTAVAVLTLALGIGANTAIFSVVSAVLIRPLPYSHPERIVFLWGAPVFERVAKAGPQGELALVDWFSHTRSFEDTALYQSGEVNLAGADQPDRVKASQVTTDFFRVLGIQPHGRAFLAEESVPGRDQAVILSDQLCRRFGAPADVIGRSVLVNGISFTVVGVMPAGFTFPGKTQLWMPLPLPWNFQASHINADTIFFTPIARLRPGVSLAQARDEVLRVAFPVSQANADEARKEFEIKPLRESLVGNNRPVLWLLLGAVGFVLLIACADVANLLLARAVVREKEMTVRAALGATRSRLFSQNLAESLLLSCLGGSAGLLLASWSLGGIRLLVPANMLPSGPIRIDGGVLVFTLGVSLASGLLFGVFPSLHAYRSDLSRSLKQGGHLASSDRGLLGHTRSLLTVVEAALSLVLLVGAGLFLRSFSRLGEVNPGFNPERLMTTQVNLAEGLYQASAKRIEFYEGVLERVAALPGVRSAAFTSNLPLSGTVATSAFRLQVKEESPHAGPEGDAQFALLSGVSPSYFRAMGIPLLAGRLFTNADGEGAPKVAIVSESLARAYWPGEIPLGKHLSFPGQVPDWREIVGVVGDTRHASLAAQPSEDLYFPLRQNASYACFLIIRTEGTPALIAAEVRRTVAEVDRNEPLADFLTMEQHISNSMAGPRFRTVLLGIFAFLALTLAVVGLYGVMSYTVSQRTREIGIRVAMGARREDVLRLVVGQGFRLTLVGVGMGIAGALALSRFLSSLLYGVRPVDPFTFVAASLALTVAALLASYIPARRATKVDPMVALRYE